MSFFSPMKHTYLCTLHHLHLRSILHHLLQIPLWFPNPTSSGFGGRTRLQLPHPPVTSPPRGAPCGHSIRLPHLRHKRKGRGSAFGCLVDVFIPGFRILIGPRKCTCCPGFSVQARHGDIALQPLRLDEIRLGFICSPASSRSDQKRYVLPILHLQPMMFKGLAAHSSSVNIKKHKLIRVKRQLCCHQPIKTCVEL